MKNNKIKNIMAVLITAAMITSSLSSCKAFDFFGSSSDSTIDSSVESTDVNEVESENIDESSEDTESVSQIEIDSWTDDNAIITTQTQQSTNEETTTKQTTTTTTKSFFDIFTPKTTTTTRKATTTSKKTTTTTSNRTQTSTTSSTRSTTTTTKATQTTQAQQTDYSISFNNSNGVMLTSYKTPSALYAKWGNSDLNAQGALFGADYVLIKGGYGACSIVCSNLSKNNEIIIKSNNSVIEISEIIGNNPREGVILKANGAGKATITASIPNNTKTFSFTVAVVTEDQVISTYEKEAMRIVNQYRTNAGVPALALDSGLKSAAKTRAKECAIKFSHTRPDGTDYARVFPDKYLHGGWLVNENIAKGYEVPVSACRGWYNSSGHRTTMLSTNYDRAGLAVCIADNGTFYWVLDVAGPSGMIDFDDSETAVDGEPAE